MTIIFTADKLATIRSKLRKELKKVDSQIKSIENIDVLNSQALPETSEVSTASWEADVKFGALIIKEKLIDLKNKIIKTLRKVESGTYGICDRCKSYINPQRLEALPIAITCSSC